MEHEQGQFRRKLHLPIKIGEMLLKILEALVAYSVGDNWLSPRDDKVV